jgi:hypothetical protein
MKAIYVHTASWKLCPETKKLILANITRYILTYFNDRAEMTGGILELPAELPKYMLKQR